MVAMYDSTDRFDVESQLDAVAPHRHTNQAIGDAVGLGLAAYAAYRVHQDHRQHAAYVSSLPPAEQAAHHERQQHVKLIGALMLLLGILLLVIGGHSWVATGGVVLGIVGFFTVI